MLACFSTISLFSEPKIGDASESASKCSIMWELSLMKGFFITLPMFLFVAIWRLKGGSLNTEVLNLNYRSQAGKETFWAELCRWG